LETQEDFFLRLAYQEETWMIKTVQVTEQEMAGLIGAATNKNTLYLGLGVGSIYDVDENAWALELLKEWREDT
jgi:hypothetical protein